MQVADLDRVIRLGTGERFTVAELQRLIDTQPDSPKGRRAANILAADLKMRERRSTA